MSRNRPTGFGPQGVKVLYTNGSGEPVALSELHSELASRFAAWDAAAMKRMPQRKGCERVAIRELFDGERELYRAIGDPLADDEHWMCVNKRGSKPMNAAQRAAVIADCETFWMPP